MALFTQMILKRDYPDENDAYASVFHAQPFPANTNT